MSEEPAAILAPRETSNLYGHEAAERALLDAYNSRRLAHAWLLCGPRGIGKATLAYRFARFVLAEAGQGGESPLFGGEAAPPTSLSLASDHPVFRRVASGGHADLLTVERTEDERGRLRSEIVVDDARAIAGFLHLTPAEGGWRVVIIDGVEDMNRNAANAVLKIVEEPPPKALILMVSHAPGRLLSTIRSRSRRLTLRPLANAVIERILTEQLPAASREDILALARFAEGSVGQALTLAQQGGPALFQELLGLLQGLPRLNVAALHQFADRMSGASGAGVYRTATDLLLWWLARLVRAGGLDQVPEELAPGEAALYARLAAQRNLDRWLEVWEKTRYLVSRAESLNLDRKQVILNTFLAIEGLARA